jgi:hypothetical protein
VRGTVYILTSVVLLTVMKIHRRILQVHSGEREFHRVSRQDDLNTNEIIILDPIPFIACQFKAHEYIRLTTIFLVDKIHGCP